MYRQTYNELSRLSNRELYDLGIDRSEIEIVARETTYGNEEVKINFNFFDIFKTKTEKDVIEEYLANSANAVDLENRLRNIDRGLAPWQLRANYNLQGLRFNV